MPELNYTIKTGAELAGAQAAADALERQIGKAKALKQDYSELQQQLDTVRGSLDKYKEEQQASNVVIEVSQEDIKEASKATEAFGGHMREAHHIIGELNRIVPGLGELLRAAIVPVFGLVAGVIYLFSKWVENIRETNAALKEMADTEVDLQKITDGTEALNAQMDVLREHATDADAFADTLNHIADAEKNLTEAADSNVEALKRQHQANQEEMRAFEEMELAKVRAALAAKIISPEEAKRQEDQIRGNYSSESAAAQSKQEKDVISARKKELDDLTQEKNKLDMFPILTQERPEGAKQAAETQKKIAEQRQKDVDDQTAWMQKNGQYLSPDEFSKQLAKQNQLIQSANQEAEAASKAADHAKEVEKAWADNKAALDEVNRKIAALNKSIPDLEAQHTEGEKHRSAMLEIEGQKTTGEKAAGEIGAAESVADKVTAGEKPTTAEAQLLMQMANAASGHLNNLAQAAAYFEKLKTNGDKMAFAISALAAADEATQRRIDDALARIKNVAANVRANQTQ
ncbi:MAG: hypothetical protein ABSH15_04255 [Verrucomicrobiota bacterium]|jgi:chromosome segregation ATPase